MAIRCILLVAVLVAFATAAESDTLKDFNIKHDSYPYIFREQRKKTDGEVIDLDDVTPEEATAGLSLSRNNDDTSDDVETPDGDTEHDASLRIQTDDDDTLGPILTNILNIIEDSQEEFDNATLVDDEDEEMASGSGSGDFIEIEEVLVGAGNVSDLVVVQQEPENTTEYYSADDDSESVDDLDSKPNVEINDKAETSSEETESPLPIPSPTTSTSTTEQPTTERQDLPPYCEELSNATWAPWSPWIRSGDSDIRFRRCRSQHGQTLSIMSCEGSYFDVRPCVPRNVKACRTVKGDVTEEFDMVCSGLDLRDLKDIDELENPFDSTDNCEFTLYDLKYNLAIGVPLTTDGLLMTADPKMWCNNRDKFLPFYTPTQYCRKTLQTFCKVNKRCHYDAKPRKDIKNKGDYKKKCWEQFVLGGVLPEGLPSNKGSQMICQKFDKHGMYGKILDHKQDLFATVYDPVRRIPLMSLTVVRELGDDKWPELPFLIERGLVPEETGTLTWFFKEKKKGITRLEDIHSDCDTDYCKYGRKQAMIADYEFSGYRVAQLLTPEVIGGNLGKRIATFTLTNTAAMLPTVYPSWKRGLSLVRKFAKTECKLPETGRPFLNVTQSNPNGRGNHNYPEMYVISGVVPSIRHEEVLGNDVNVPSLFWVAACCAHGAEVTSFGLYAYNQFGQSARAVSVQNLQLLLQTSFYDSMEMSTVKLFPAYDSVCSSPDNDLSYKIEL